MKKLTALLTAVFMLLCCMAAAEEWQVTGAWYLQTMQTEGMEMRASDVGMAMTLQLEDGGAGMVTTGNMTEPLRWTLDGAKLTVVVAEDPMVFEVSAEALVSEELDGMVMIFTREQPEDIFVPAAAVSAEDIAQFDGLWAADYVSAYGVYLPVETVAEAMGLTDPTILIQNGQMVKFSSGMAEKGTLEDGRLVVPTMYGENDPDGLLGTTVTLLEDGSIELYYAQMLFHCVRVEQAAAEAPAAA